MKAKIDGIDIHYEISGSGPWVTLSHSLATNLDMWDSQLDLLSQHFTVLRYDIRGHGQTQTTEDPYSLEQLADDIHGLLLHLGITQTHWIGMSLGGMIGQVLAIRHPNALSHIVIAGSTGKAAPNAATMWGDRATIARTHGMSALVKPTLSRWFTDPYREKNPELMSRIGNMITNTPAEGYANCCAAITVINTLAGLKNLRNPGLVIVGDQDLATPPAASEQIHRHWPNSKCVVLKDAAHLCSIEQAHRFNHEVMKFIDTHH